MELLSSEMRVMIKTYNIEKHTVLKIYIIKRYAIKSCAKIKIVSSKLP
jgi:hypothetical protein